MKLAYSQIDNSVILALQNSGAKAKIIKIDYTTLTTKFSVTAFPTMTSG